jgi:hypothetical protein
VDIANIFCQPSFNIWYGYIKEHPLPSPAEEPCGQLTYTLQTNTFNICSGRVDIKGENCVLQLKYYLKLFQVDGDVPPLHTAANVGNKEIVKLLLINGINPNIQSENVFFDISYMDIIYKDTSI